MEAQQNTIKQKFGDIIWNNIWRKTNKFQFQRRGEPQFLNKCLKTEKLFEERMAGNNGLPLDDGSRSPRCFCFSYEQNDLLNNVNARIIDKMESQNN